MHRSGTNAAAGQAASAHAADRAHAWIALAPAAMSAESVDHLRAWTGGAGQAAVLFMRIAAVVRQRSRSWMWRRQGSWC